MSADKAQPLGIQYFCLAVRPASRALGRFYEEELRGIGLRPTPSSLRHDL